MRSGRERWSRHVTAWRRSGLSKNAYHEQHEMPYSLMWCWSGGMTEATEPESQWLVELEPAVDGAEHGGDQAPIELAVGDRYVLRQVPAHSAYHRWCLCKPAATNSTPLSEPDRGLDILEPGEQDQLVDYGLHESAGEIEPLGTVTQGMDQNRGDTNFGCRGA